MILKHIFRSSGQTKTIYFSGWEYNEKNQLSSGFTGDTNHPTTSWLAGALVMSKTNAQREFEKFDKHCKNLYGGKTYIIKEKRALRAGWRG
jgi:hypothetical protein